ncbi:MAG TPA: hypothetical protein VFJ82_17820 [Longimicrobium sp.]|nr:hypothetical protein [Longimicrobium sp.]
MNALDHLLAELRRRRVFRVLVGYCAGAMVVIEAVNNIFPALALPAWASHLVVVLALLGLPVALGLAWAFDVTPRGIRRTPEEPDGPAPQAPPVRRRVPGKVAAAGVAGMVAVAGVAAYAGLGRGAAAPGEAEFSVAVLPFVNMSGDSANEYFSDGITEEILDALSNVPGLRVPARTSSFAFKGRSGDVAEIGRQLRVTHVLEGSVQRAGDRVRITAQLVDARSGFHQWSHAYTVQVTDVFAVEDEISRDIARQLQVRLSPGVRLTRGGTDNPQAHDLYLQGRRLIFAPAGGDRRKANLMEAITTFQRALAVDSTYALAWSGIADAYNRLADDYWAPREADPRAKQAALRALALDPNLAQAHAALGQTLLFYDWDFRGAERELRRAIALDPDDPLPHEQLGFFYEMQRRFHEAKAEHMTAARADPATPQWETNFMRTRALDGEGEHLYDSLRAVVRSRPHDNRARYQLIIVADLTRHWREEAAYIAEARKAFPGEWIQSSPGDPLLYARAGDTLAARRGMDSLLAHAAGHYQAATSFAAAHAALGDRDAALQWLERAYQDRDYALVFLDSDDFWDPLRGDPRFEDIRRRVGLPYRR